MKRHTVFAISDVVSFVLTFVFLIAVLFAAIQLIEIAVELAVAIIAFAGVVVGGLLRYTAEMAKTREQALRTERQQNYLRLIQKMVQHARGPGVAGYDPDAIIAEHIGSWVFGGDDVVKTVCGFMARPSRRSLKESLLAMRESVGLPTLDLEGYDYQVLFPNIIYPALPDE